MSIKHNQQRKRKKAFLLFCEKAEVDFDDSEIKKAFHTGFNMGWNHGRKKQREIQMSKEE